MASLVPSGRDDGCGRHARAARRPAVHRNHPRSIGATIRERGRDVRRAARCVALLTRSAVRSGRDDCRHRRAALSWRAPLRRRPLRQASALHPDALRAASRRCQEVRRQAPSGPQVTTPEVRALPDRAMRPRPLQGRAARDSFERTASVLRSVRTHAAADPRSRAARSDDLIPVAICGQQATSNRRPSAAATAQIVRARRTNERGRAEQQIARCANHVLRAMMPSATRTHHPAPELASGRACKRSAEQSFGD